MSKARKGQIGIPEAIEVFARGFAFTRSRTHPFLAEKHDGLWTLRDGPRRRGDYRREEWVAHDMTAAAVDRLARQGTRGRYCVCAIRSIDQPDGELRRQYREAGYRLGTTEAMMVHDLRRVPRLTGPLPVRRVSDRAEADALAKAAGQEQIPGSELESEHPRIRQYAAWDGNRPVGWAQSIVVEPWTWCANVFVMPRYRRRGIGRAMIAQLLRDDRAAASRGSVLLASHTGCLLYQAVGYRQIGELLLYTPVRR